MQIILQLKPPKKLKIPFSHFYQLQSSVYKLLSRTCESYFWHSIGFGNKTKYKGFCFSDLKGQCKTDMENKQLIFEDTVSFEIRSPVFDFIDAFQRAVEINPSIQFFDTRLDIVGASLCNIHLKDGITRMKAVTPIVVHTTEDSGHTIFYSPNDKEFFIKLCQNMESKLEAIRGSTCDMLHIRSCGKMKKIVTNYKGIWITGYQGSVEIEANAKTAEFIYNTGIGEKNSEGFGFVELL